MYKACLRSDFNQTSGGGWGAGGCTRYRSELARMRWMLVHERVCCLRSLRSSDTKIPLHTSEYCLESASTFKLACVFLRHVIKKLCLAFRQKHRQQ